MLDRRNLPSVVLARIDATELVGAAAQVRVTQGLEEERLAAAIEFRRSADGVPGVEGYASSFDAPYEVMGGAPYGWTEIVDRRAFDRALLEKDDVRMLINHAGVPIARTKSGTLTLDTDKVGLRSDAPVLDLSNPDVQTVRSALERGDIDQMSFAFRTTRQEWNKDYTERRILEVRLFDVSIVTYPGNPATAAQLRSEQPTQLPGIPLALALAIQQNRVA